MEISTDFLNDELSEKLANLITGRLEARSISKPLVIIDLFYHYADFYIPLVSYLTIDGLEKALASGDSNFLNYKRGRYILIQSLWTNKWIS